MAQRVEEIFHHKTMVATLDELAQGLCVGKENTFLNPRGRTASKQNRATCRICPALLTCTIYATHVPHKVGTWAGITYPLISSGRTPTYD